MSSWGRTSSIGKDGQSPEGMWNLRYETRMEPERWQLQQQTKLDRKPQSCPLRPSGFSRGYRVQPIRDEMTASRTTGVKSLLAVSQRTAFKERSWSKIPALKTFEITGVRVRRRHLLGSQQSVSWIKKNNCVFQWTGEINLAEGKKEEGLI